MPERFRERAELATSIYNSWKSVLEETPPDEYKMKDEARRTQCPGRAVHARRQPKRRMIRLAVDDGRTDGHRDAIRYPAQDDRISLSDSSLDEDTDLTRQGPPGNRLSIRDWVDRYSVSITAGGFSDDAILNDTAEIRQYRLASSRPAPGPESWANWDSPVIKHRWDGIRRFDTSKRSSNEWIAWHYESRLPANLDLQPKSKYFGDQNLNR
ncbi:hypothetical protein FRB99_001430 [Tulasnella sp. 403]|nr:hypothetical protein FRB99_001430 [Tulasnella sp. 403]